MKKKIVILVPHGHRLANQLWNFMSIYAYCLEKGYVCENPSFFRYHRFFSFPGRRSMLSLFLSFLNALPWQRARGFSYALYERYIAWLRAHRKLQMIADKREPHVFYLPPSETAVPEYKEALSKIGKNSLNTFYFDGWLFRNPIGIEKYRKEIVSYFSPREDIKKRVEDFILPLRKKFPEIVGVQIRQGDYRMWINGLFFFEPEDIRSMLASYLSEHKKDSRTVLFLICSDGPVNLRDFAGLHVLNGPGDAMGDLFALAKTNLIIGSDSTYGAFAAYYGNIPLAVFSRGGIDWSKINLGGGYNHANACTNIFS